MSRTPVQIANEWSGTCNDEQLRDVILWLQRDSEYVYGRARATLEGDALAKRWLAAKMQDAAAHSAEIARHLMFGEA